MSRTACQQVLCIVVWLVCISQADTFASSWRNQAIRGVGFLSALRMPNAGLEHVMVHKPFTSIAGQKDTAGARVLGGHLFGSLCFLGAAQARGMPRGRGRTLSGLQMGGFSRSNSGSDHEESADEVFTNGVDGEWRREEWEQLPKIFVLLFNPRTDNEGIYTLQIKRRDGQLVNTIVMFEDTEDAERYSGLLEAQDFPSPSVEIIEPSEIKDFAQGAGYQTTFIPKGTLFMPPENNVGDRPWSPEIDPSVDSDVSSTRDSARDEELEVMRSQLERSYWGGMPQ